MGLCKCICILYEKMYSWELEVLRKIKNKREKYLFSE